MKVTYPHYYPAFRCTASACTDTCCVGWEIDIDDAAFLRYQNQTGVFGRRLREHILTDGTPHFQLQKERCPFLNEENLCDIILTLGEGALCEICTEHPRFHAWFGAVKESGLGLCCEAAARLIVENEAPDTLIHTRTDEPVLDDLPEGSLFDALCAARERLWSMLQRRSESIWKRLAAALRFSCALQDCLDGEAPGDAIAVFLADYDAQPDGLFCETAQAPCGLEETLFQILSFFLSLESMDESWPGMLADIRAHLSAVVGQRRLFLDQYRTRAYEYEHLAICFLYRYMLKSVFDGDVLSKIKLMAVSLVLLSVMDTACWQETHAFSLQDRIRIAKAYSKQIEYSEENLLQFQQASWEQPFLSAQQLVKLLMQWG